MSWVKFENLGKCDVCANKGDVCKICKDQGNGNYSHFEEMKPRKLIHESLTDDQAFYLGQLVEEATEIAHRAMKCLWYGLKDHHPVVGKPNDSALAFEIGNFEEIVGRCEQVGIVLDDSMLGMSEKSKNLKKYHGR